MLLRDRMKEDWHQLTLQEKKAGMHISKEALVFFHESCTLATSDAPSHLSSTLNLESGK